jgi:hypothetical protein
MRVAIIRRNIITALTQPIITGLIPVIITIKIKKKGRFLPPFF